MHQLLLLNLIYLCKYMYIYIYCFIEHIYNVCVCVCLKRGKERAREMERDRNIRNYSYQKLTVYVFKLKRTFIFYSLFSQGFNEYNIWWYEREDFIFFLWRKDVFLKNSTGNNIVRKINSVHIVVSYEQMQKELESH